MTTRRPTPLRLRHAAASAAALAAATGATSIPTDTTSSADPPGFRYEAARLCTEALNTHPLDGPEDETLGVVIEILEMANAGTTPTANDLDRWTATVRESLDRLGSIHSDLSGLQSPDAAEQAAWDTIVTSDADAVASNESRLALLETGDWEQIADGYMPLRPGSSVDTDQLEQAFALLELENSDCTAVYWAAAASDRTSPTFAFESAAATVCTTISNRRLADDFAGSVDTNLEALVAVLEDRPDELPDGLDAALRVLAAEWAQTTADLSTIDSSGPGVPREWERIVAAAEERIGIFQARLDAVTAGDPVALGDAYDTANYEYPGLDFATVGLDQRSCRGVTS